MHELNLSRRSIVVGLLLLLLLLGRQLRESAQASALPRPATQNLIGWTGIVFQTFRHGNWEIYLSGPPDGEVRLTNHGASDTAPRLTVGGTKIAFVSDRDGNDEIYTMNLDGSAQTRLTYEGAVDHMPQWSPDGQQLIFMSQRSGNGDIYLMNANGSNQHAIVTDGNQDLYPTWSSDGARIAWVRLYPKERNRPQLGEIWQANPDGSNAHALTGKIATPARPIWSPDGTKLAFDADLNGDGYQELVVGDSNGTNLHPVTESYPTQQWWMGTWTLDSNAIFATERNYTFDGTTVGGLLSTYVKQICLYTQVGCSNIATDSTAMMPDVQSLDVAAPVSQVDPLPTWSRLSGFTVQWSGQDVGASGLAAYDVAYRHAEDRDWTVWLNGTQPDPAIPIGPGGERGAGTFMPSRIGHYYFRSRAIDGADHLEPWPAAETGDATTRVFRWYLSGQVTDNRGLAQAHYPVPLTPAPMDGGVTDGQGFFQMHLGTPGSYTLADDIRLSMNQDRRRNYYLLPDDTIIQHGGFETILTESAWHTNGAVQTVAGDALAHSGQRAVQLGRPCPDSCIVTLPLETSGQLSLPHLVSAPDGTLHLFAHKMPTTLIHQVRTPEGRWLPYNVLANGIYSWTPDTAFDEKGDLHLVWSNYEFGGQNYLHYTRYQIGVGWTQPTALGRGMGPRMALDSQDQPQIVYQCDEITRCPDATLYYRKVTSNGGWTAPAVLATAVALRSYDLVHNRGITYVAWGEWPGLGALEQLQVISTVDGQQWGRPTVLHRGVPPATSDAGLYASLQLINDAQQQLHLAWFTMGTPEISYTSQQSGAWSPIEQLQTAAGIAGYDRLYLRADGENTIHLFAGGQAVSHWQRRREQWSAPTPLNLFPTSQQFLRDVALDPNGALYFALDDFTPTIEVKTSAKVEEAAVATLAQSVHLSTTLHQPTLAFLYQLSGGHSGGESTFAVSVTQGLTTTQLFTTTATTEWQPAWADMRPWQGETVTITLSVAQAIGDPYLQVTVDMVTLGSWRTPLTYRVEPNHIALGSAPSVTIRGENFQQLPKVWVGARQLTTVNWIDVQTLTATLPADLPPGIYDLTVVNPSGERYLLPSALGVGEQVYLPIVE